jgi:Lecithin:cholesterol acyltransferase
MTTGAAAVTDPLVPDTSHDAVVIVPGLMGSVLVEAGTGRTLWGFTDLRWYVRAWTTGAGLADLHLSDQERQGRYGRVRAAGLLRMPAYARILAGFEPYARLADQVRAVAAHPAAVLEFPYDWRLPVAHNGRLLAEAATAHLQRWRAHEAHDAARRRHPAGRAAQLVLVAHSMGGLLARYLSLIPGASDDVRATVTLGTPFYGSVKAAVLLNTGRGAPLPARRPLAALLRRDADAGVRALAATLPGVHDLMPTYRCLDAGSTARRLTPADVVALGGDAELAEAARDLHSKLAGARLVGHRAVVGVAQPTPQSITLQNGVVRAHRYACEGEPGAAPQRVDRAGDATVYRESASLHGGAHTYLPQQHGSLARTDEAIACAVHIVTERDPDAFGPPLGAGEIGLDLPDLVAAGEEWTAEVTGVENPRAARCQVRDAGTGRLVDLPPLEPRDGALHVRPHLPGPGLYSVHVAGSGRSPVSQLVLAGDARR